MSDIHYHAIPGAARIAYRYTQGTGPCFVFLPGYMSDMDGSKASALFDWARANQRACLLMDYSGCGRSEGQFADGTLSQWRNEVLALIAALGLERVVLVGSSMGGWLMLLAGLALKDRLAGLIGIAAAPDFTQWGYDGAQRAALAAGETVFEDNPYGPDPTPTHPGFFADAEAQCLLGSPVAITAPVRLLHGQQDADVPFDISVRLAAALRSGDVQVTLVKQGDHRLSRPQDIALLLRTADTLLTQLAMGLERA